MAPRVVHVKFRAAGRPLVAFCHDGKYRPRWHTVERWRREQIDDAESADFARRISAVVNRRVTLWTADLYIRAAFPPRILMPDGSARHMTRERCRFDR